MYVTASLKRIFVSFSSAELAIKLCEDDDLLRCIAECAERDTIIGLCAEGRRLTAALVKNSQSIRNFWNFFIHIRFLHCSNVISLCRVIIVSRHME